MNFYKMVAPSTGFMIRFLTILVFFFTSKLETYDFGMIRDVLPFWRLNRCENAGESRINLT